MFRKMRKAVCAAAAAALMAVVSVTASADYIYDFNNTDLVDEVEAAEYEIYGTEGRFTATLGDSTEEKYISLSTCHRNSYSVIDLTNSCAAPPVQRGGRLLTTKADKLSHGFGMKSVEKTIRKYQGDFNWDYHAGEKRFTATVMLTDGPAEAAP